MKSQDLSRTSYDALSGKHEIYICQGHPIDILRAGKGLTTVLLDNSVGCFPDGPA